MSTPTDADISIELSLTVTGTYIPAVSPPTPEDPEASIEDVAISALTFYTTRTHLDADSNLVRVLVSHDLLEGVDTSDPNVQLLLSNLLTLVHDEAVEALFEANAE